MNDSAIRHLPDSSRFETSIDGHRCVLDYRLQGTIMTITHTGVPSAVGGRGIAGQLTQAALDTARQEGWKIVPACSYADAYFRRHPEASDLLYR